MSSPQAGTVGTAPTQSAAGPWVKMFNGKDLAGWKALHHPEVWSVKDGAIVGRHTASAGDDWLPTLLFYTKAQLRDGEFKAELKLTPGGISSMYFRAQLAPGFAPAYIAQANNTGPNPRRTGSLYNFVDVFAQLVPDDTWWTQHVIFRGNHIRILVNGTEVVNFVDSDNTHTEGHLALLHYLPGSMVQARNVMMRPLSPAP
jgi:hypothetical protein